MKGKQKDQQLIHYAF